MINFEEAKQIALNEISSDCALLTDSIIEKPYGWYFNFQSKKYVETGNFSEMLVGSGGFVVEEQTGKVVRFSSAYSLEKNFEVYEKGFLSGNYDLIILKVKETHSAVRLLHKLKMTYVEPEFAHGAKWKIPKELNEKQIKDALSNLPHTFENQKFTFSFDTFEEIDNSGCLFYELRKHQK